VGEPRWFFRSAEEWNAIAQRLKQTPCPHCHAVGTLIQHGFLRGFDESSKQATVRARRIYCSNRNARRGCGRTFSIWRADKIRRLSLTTHGLWRFLQHAVAGSLAAALRASDCPRSDRTWLRLWKRFHHAQCHIRTALLRLCPPPEISAPLPRRPAAQVLAHLQAAFPNAPCPVAAFQQATRTFFL